MPVVNETPSFPEVLQQAIRAQLLGTHTALPGQVLKYDSVTGLAEVQPMFMKKYADNPAPIPLPVIPDVPVIHPRTAQGMVQMPIATGDYVLLVCCERKIDDFLDKGVPSPPGADRIHSLTDAVAIPGFYPKTVPLPTTILPSDMLKLVLTNGTLVIKLNPTGQLQILNQLNIDMIQILIDFMTAVSTAQVATLIGPQPLIPIPPTAFATAIANMTTFLQPVP